MSPFENQVSEGLLAYLTMMEPITPVFHLAYMILFFRLILYASWVRSPFEWFITANYAMFLFLPFGWLWNELKAGRGLILSQRMPDHLPIWSYGGGFGFSGISLAIMALVVYQWYQEARDPQNVYEFRHIPWWRWWVILVMAWGFFYPFYPFQGSHEFHFLGWTFPWRSPFGVLFAPTTTFFLGLLSLIFPRVNRQLFLVLSLAGLVVALHTFGISPFDLPMGIIAIFNLGLLFLTRHTRSSSLAPMTVL